MVVWDYMWLLAAILLTCPLWLWLMWCAARIISSAVIKSLKDWKKEQKEDR